LRASILFIHELYSINHLFAHRVNSFSIAGCDVLVSLSNMVFSNSVVAPAARAVWLFSELSLSFLAWHYFFSLSISCSANNLPDSRFYVNRKGGAGSDSAAFKDEILIFSDVSEAL